MVAELLCFYNFNLGFHLCLIKGLLMAPKFLGFVSAFSEHFQTVFTGIICRDLLNYL